MSDEVESVIHRDAYLPLVTDGFFARVAGGPYEPKLLNREQATDASMIAKVARRLALADEHEPVDIIMSLAFECELLLLKGENHFKEAVRGLVQSLREMAVDIRAMAEVEKDPEVAKMKLVESATLDMVAKKAFGGLSGYAWQGANWDGKEGA